MTDDEELSRLAVEALLREAQRGAVRAEISGPSGWLKCKQPSTNKTFLRNTLLGAMASNRAKEKQDQTRSERGRLRRERGEEKNKYRRVYLQATSKQRKKTGEAEEEEEKRRKEENQGTEKNENKNRRDRGEKRRKGERETEKNENKNNNNNNDEGKDISSRSKEKRKKKTTAAQFLWTDSGLELCSRSLVNQAVCSKVNTTKEKHSKPEEKSDGDKERIKDHYISTGKRNTSKPSLPFFSTTSTSSSNTSLALARNIKFLSSSNSDN